MSHTETYVQVLEHYGTAARGSDEEYGRRVATAFGYSEQELAETPGDANLGLSCGNPIALASLSEGETVIDLGSGAGFDVFLAAKKVGAGGRVVGVDMNKEMLERANRNKTAVKADNVTFLESRITDIALPSGSADCIISNCVVNLVPEPEKPGVFTEMFRLLRSGGRVAISDILARKELSEEIQQNMALYVGCIAGASQVHEYERYLRDAGFKDVLIVDTKNDLNVYQSASDEKPGNRCGEPSLDKSMPCCGPKSAAKQTVPVQDLQGTLDFNDLAGSFKIYALRP